MSKSFEEVDPAVAYAAAAMAAITGQTPEDILREGTSSDRYSRGMRVANLATTGRHHRTEDMAHHTQPETDVEKPLDHYFR